MELRDYANVYNLDIDHPPILKGALPQKGGLEVQRQLGKSLRAWPLKGSGLLKGWQIQWGTHIISWHILTGPILLCKYHWVNVCIFIEKEFDPQSSVQDFVCLLKLGLWYCNPHSLHLKLKCKEFVTSGQTITAVNCNAAWRSKFKGLKHKRKNQLENLWLRNFCINLMIIILICTVLSLINLQQINKDMGW